MSTTNLFFDRPILNSPYKYPARHWELDASGQPTQRIIEKRRRAEFITPIPKPRKRKGPAEQQQLIFDEGKGLSTQKQQYDPTSIINQIRQHVNQWRSLPNPNQWQVTPETARLLQHWRKHPFSSLRPFFCQVEAAETAIWLIEVAPQAGKPGKSFIEHLANANHDANPELMRFALKLATGAGKTTVMAMLIAWQTINAVRRPQSRKFTRGFLVVTPGLTIKDRLRVLQPNDPDSYYASRELVPLDMLDDNFRGMAADEIERFRREIFERGGKLADQLQKGKDLDDVTLLREVMNTVGKHGQLGGSIRCVVSVSMLTEGWDARTVTHVLGLRAFGTQLLCEQVIGRALRRQSYDLNEEDLFWEAEFCRVAEFRPRVRAYVKNHNLGLEVPYRYGSEMRKYLPDFIVLVDDGHGGDNLLHLIVEIKGYRREDAKEKKSTMETCWVPGVNRTARYGRWAFVEFTEVYQIEADFKAKVESEFNKMVEHFTSAAKL